METDVIVLFVGVGVVFVFLTFFFSFGRMPPCDLSYAFSAVVFGDALEFQFFVNEGAMKWRNARADVTLTRREKQGIEELEFKILVKECRGFLKYIFHDRKVSLIAYHMSDLPLTDQSFQTKFRTERLGEKLLEAYDALENARRAAS